MGIFKKLLIIPLLGLVLRMQMAIDGTNNQRSALVPWHILGRYTLLLLHYVQDKGSGGKRDNQQINQRSGEIRTSRYLWQGTLAFQASTFLATRSPLHGVGQGDKVKGYDYNF